MTLRAMWPITRPDRLSWELNGPVMLEDGSPKLKEMALACRSGIRLVVRVTPHKV
jgi:hypothetical protein